ncbi:MAG: redoxin domain-containing protein [Woeseia sp.]
MTRKLMVAVLLVAAEAGGYLLRSQLQDKEVTAINTAPVNDQRLEFTLADLEGLPREFAEWDGKPRIVNFWATWCAPCRREIPLLKDTQDKHGSDGLQILGIAVDFVEDVKAYAEDAQFNYPILVGQDDAMAVAETSGVPFIGLPFTLIVAPDGRMLGAHMGEIHAEQIETIVQQFALFESGATSIDEVRSALKQL